MRTLAVFALLTIAVSAAAAPTAEPPSTSTASASQPEKAAARVLLFSKTAGFRHDSIPAGIEAIKRLGTDNKFSVEATEDAALFTEQHLNQYAAVVFLNTTGDVLNDEQQIAFQRYIRAGHGFVGVHSATDTEYDWPWYGQLVGAYFSGHPTIQQATIRVVDREHISTKHLEESWQRTDEWYNFRPPTPTPPSPAPTPAPAPTAPPERMHVLLTLDETTYQGGTMNGNHPIAWCHEFDGGRAWYTGCGHTIESYSEEAFLQHLLGGIQWAMNDDGQKPQ